MAESIKSVPRISRGAQKNVLSYLQGILTAHKKNAEMHTKMTAIDVAYARYTGSGNEVADATGTDSAANFRCGALTDDKIVVPIVISQVDSLVGYLADVFLSGSPMFPVVSKPSNRIWAEQLETLLDDHAELGGYTRQLLMFLRDGVKYNVAAIEADWDVVEQFSVSSDYTQATGRAVARNEKYFTKLKRLDMYNTFWDTNVNPGDVSAEGDFAGYIEILSATKLKRLLNKLGKAEEAYNALEALGSKGYVGTSSGLAQNYTMHPTINNYIAPRRPDQAVDWEQYLTGNMAPTAKIELRGNNFEVITFYARILPSEFGIIGPQQNTPQIWKFKAVNGSIIIQAKRIISAQDMLPILFGQPLEDGLGYQTQSVAESQIDIQEGATTLLDIRFSAARRAVSDRALYDASMISPKDINAPVPAPKIPVKINPLNQNQTLASAYQQIPFSLSGTESTIQDATVLANFSKELSGLNNARQGQFQKGNKSVTEWNDTMGGADNRLRLPALTLEVQTFMPLKNILKLNIFQYGQNVEVVSQKNGEVYKIDIDQLRQQVLSFKIADGFTPKSKMASTEAIANGMNLIMNSPMLQQAFGPMLPGMFIHLMSLSGIKGMEEYNPQTQQAPAPAGIAGAALQAPVAPPSPDMQAPSSAEAGAPALTNVPVGDSGAPV